MPAETAGALVVAKSFVLHTPVRDTLRNRPEQYTMSNPKNGSAYGAPAGDTDFRKTWDLDEYAEKAKEREAKEKEEAKARYEAKLAGKKYYKPMTGDETYTSARRNVMDFTGQVGKTQLVGAGAGVGKRGRGAGFYCEACDLTFKDNLQVRSALLLCSRLC